jgi:hypothetical protein
METGLLDLCSLHWEHRTSTTTLQGTLWAAFFRWAQAKPASLASASVVHLQVCMGLPNLLLPYGFYWKAYRNIVRWFTVLGVWPICLHFLFYMSILMRFWLVFFHRLLFDMASGHLILRIRSRHLLIKDWSWLIFVVTSFRGKQKNCF